MLVDVFGVRACVPSRASVGICVALEARVRERPRICLLAFRRVQYEVEHPEVVKRALTAVRIVQYVMEVFGRLEVSSVSVEVCFRSFGATESNEILSLDWGRSDPVRGRQGSAGGWWSPDGQVTS